MNKRLHFSSLKNVLCTALWVNCLIGFPLPWGELQRASPPIIQACITKKKTHSIPSELLGTNIEDQKSRRMKKRYIEVKSECKLERQKIRAETRVLRWRSSQILFWGFESLKELWILSVCSWNQKNKGWIKRINDWIVKKNLKKGCRQEGKTIGYFQVRRCWISLLFSDKQINMGHGMQSRTKKDTLTGLNHNQSIREVDVQFNITCS